MKVSKISRMIIYLLVGLIVAANCIDVPIIGGRTVRWHSAVLLAWHFIGIAGAITGGFMTEGIIAYLQNGPKQVKVSVVIAAGFMSMVLAFSLLTVISFAMASSLGSLTY